MSAAPMVHALSFLVTLGASTALGQARLDFQSFHFPDAGYRGVHDVKVTDGNAFQWQPNVNYSDRTSARIGSDGGVFNRTAGDLLRFDLTGIDAGVVTNSTLTLAVYNASNDPVQVYPLTRAWVENEANWTRASAAVPWATPGSRGALDRSAQVAAFTPLTTGALVIPLPSTVVSGWLSTPASNAGLLLEAPAMTDAFEYGSRRAPAAQRPTLRFNVGATAYTLRQGLTGYAGTTNVSIANADDPKLVSLNATSIEVSGNPGPVPNPNGFQASILLQADLTAIPPWSRVTQVTISFESCFASNTTVVPIYAMKSAWTESATWFTRNGSAMWADAGVLLGVDSDSQVLGVLPISDGGVDHFTELAEPGRSVVEGWVQSPSTNHGFLLQEPNATGEHLGCQEEESGNGPRISVQYLESEVVCQNFSCPVDGTSACTFELSFSPLTDAGLPPVGTVAQVGVSADFGQVGIAPTGLSNPLDASVVVGTPTQLYWNGPRQTFHLSLSAAESRWLAGECQNFSPTVAPGTDAGGAGGGGGGGGGGSTQGPLDTRGYSVGCGCGSAPAGLFVFTLLLLTAGSRRRRGSLKKRP